MQNIINRLKEFMESEAFIIVLFLISMMSFFINSVYPAFYTIALVMILFGITNANCTCGIGLLALWTSSSQGYEDTIDIFSPVFIILFIFLVLGGVSIIYRIVKNKSIKDILNKLKKNWIMYSMISIILAMVLSLMNTPAIKLSLVGGGNYLITLAIFLAVSLKYGDLEDARRKTLNSIIYYGFMISIEAFYKFGILLYEGKGFVDVIREKALDLGWAVSNHWAVLINLALFAAFYQFLHSKTKGRKIFNYFSMLFFIGIVLITGCRGAYIGLAVSFIAFIGYYIYFIKKNNSYPWKKDIYYFGGILGIMILGVLGLWASGYLSKILSDLTNTEGSIQNGRDVIWNIAIKKFKEHWLIGAGNNTGSYFINKETGGWWNYRYYHNHYLQMLATCGIVGAVAFTSYLVTSILRCIRKEEYSLFVLIIILYFLVHGALDTLYFNTCLEPVLVILLALIPLEKKKKEEYAVIDM